MIRWLIRLVSPIRTLLVAAMAVLTVVSAASAAHAAAVTFNHVAQGEVMLADGGWSAACDEQVEQCLPQHEDSDSGGVGGLHHHHPDFQFAALAALSAGDSRHFDAPDSFMPAGEAAFKPAAVSTADQPPKI